MRLGFLPISSPNRLSGRVEFLKVGLDRGRARDVDGLQRQFALNGRHCVVDAPPTLPHSLRGSLTFSLLQECDARF
jgi:hypothetical protein